MAEVETLSKQPRFKKTGESGDIWRLIVSSFESADSCPKWGSDRRPAWLREFVHKESILSGAVDSVCSKAVALDWQVSGGRRRVMAAQELLANGETILAPTSTGRVGDGDGWDSLLDRFLQDYFITDLGGLWELGRDGESGPVVGIYNLDSAACRLTGNVQYPIRYYPVVGDSTKSVPLRKLDFSHIVSMPSNDESMYGLGYCAVSRALSASKVLMALYRYDEEKLSDMPLPGVVSVTGLTQEQVEKAFKLYQAVRENKQKVVFKDLLWLAAQGSALQPVTTQFVPFAGVPEDFDREKVITLYVYTLALAFGVDPREFWPVSQGPLGSGKEAEIQAQKARGKGFGRMISAVERAINWDVLPEGLEFKFDLVDSEDDLLRANIQAAEISNVRKLWEPTMAGPGIIETEEARRILVERGVLPDWAAAEEEDITVHGQANVEKAIDRRIRGLVEKAQLGMGEELVAVRKNGDVETVWSSRFYSIPMFDWPGVGVPAEVPFADSIATQRRPTAIR